jgi:LmbE family N-acetylglucosaminyl deacetylase
MSRSPMAAPTGLAPTPSVELLRSIRRLRVVSNVLCVAAHPDDESTRLLSWLVHHEGVRTAYLSLTKGEGGQNLIGPERAPLLGLIRAQELLAARRIDGAEQFFGGQIDFGYSKSREETLTFWNKERALGEVVAVIRRFRPDVIVTRFAPDEINTHGHHSTSAFLAVEAFEAAADARRFPEQLPHLAPWRATRVVWNWFNLGPLEAPDPAAGFLPIEVGGYDPLLGESYPEMAARSLTMHKTQGFGSSAIRGQATEYFRVLAGAPIDASLFDGIDRSWARVNGGEVLDALLARADADYAFDEPHASVSVLLDALAALDAMPDHPWKENKRTVLCETIAGCAALCATARVDAGQVTAGGSNTVAVSLIVRSPVQVTVDAIRLRLADGMPRVLAQAVTPLSDVLVTVDGRVEWPLCPGDPGAEVDVEATIGGRSFTISRPVLHTWIDPVAGMRWEPVTVVPPVTLNPKLAVVILPDGAPRPLHVRVRASDDNVRGVVRVQAPAGVRVEPIELPFSLARAGAEELLSFTLHDAQSGVVRFVIDGRPAQELIRLDYPHIPPITLTRGAEVKISRFDMTRAGNRIGYIAGAGDEVSQALRQVGYDVTPLTDDVIESSTLSGYDAIVTGIRAFNTSRHLTALMPRLLDYVESGGSLVVQYNTNTALSALNAAIGPYPFTIGEDRVCEENAAVTLRDPTHPVFRHPNRIGPEDFSGWVQERGLCFSTSWDRHYASLISTHDKGEPAKHGGLLVATHGRGRLIYTGLSFFRQLPAGVAGAFRLFANLLAK